MAKQTKEEKLAAAKRQAAIYKKWVKEDRAVNPDNWMEAFRPDVKGKEGIESLPTYYHTGLMNQFLKTYTKAKDLGAPDIAPEKLAAMALIEGRHDIGYNEWNTANPRAKKLYTTLIQNGANPRAAGFSAAILDKTELAKKLKIPFEHAWNGLGKNVYEGTGVEYAKKVKDAEGIISHPKNQPLFDFFKSRASAEEIEQPKMASADSVEMPSEYSDGNWKLI